MKKFTLVATLLAVFFFCQPSIGWSQLFVDNFSYIPGTTLVSNGWAVTGTAATPTVNVSASSIAYPGYLSSGIGNEAALAISGEDVNHTFTSQTSGVVYASCLINVTSATLTGDYFFHLGASTIGSTYHGRVFVKRDGSNNLAFGISRAGAIGTAVFSGFTYSLNTTYLLVLKYTIVAGATNDLAAIYINPSLNSAEPGTGWISSTDTPADLANIGTVALRQGSSSNAAALKVDGVRVATVWSDIVGAGASTPTKLAITSVNGGASPLTNTPFSVTVQAQDGANSPANVTANTSINLNLATGTGSLGGTLTGTINAGSNSVTISGVTYNTAETGVSLTASATSGDLLSAGTSSAFAVVPVVTAYRSAVSSGNWNSAATWEGYTGSSWIPAYDFPTSTTKDVTIQSGHTVIVPPSFNSGSASNLTVENGATLYANAASGSCFLYVYGNIVNNGTIGGATDVIGFDIEGASCQISGSGSFIASRIAKFTTTNATTNMSIGQNMTLTYTSASSAALRNGTTTTLFNITLEAGKQLSVPNAKIDLAYCTLTLKDNASLLDNGTISGMTTNVSVERFLTKYNAIGDDMFHFLSSPVAAQAIQPGFVNLPNTTDDFYSWDETTNQWINSVDGSGAFASGFESNFTVGKGYLVAYPADVTKTFSGVLNTGNVVTALTYTPAQGNGWNLLGNPYPSAIDWNNVTSTNLDNAVYVYDNASATYKSYVAGVGTLTDGIVPSTQGFFVHANATSPSLTLENQDRVHAGTAFYKSDAIQNVVRLMVSGNNKADETIIRFAENATTAFDSQMDAYKLSGGASVPTFYSLAGNTKLSVNSLPSTSMEDYVTLAVEAGAASNYEISLTDNTLSSSVYVTLEDTKTGVSQKLNDNPVYSFTAAPGEDPSRFRLHFKDATSVANPALAGINAYSVEGQIRITSDKNLNGLVTLTDMAGRLIAKTNMNQATSCMLNVHGQTGIYVVNIATTEGNFVQKVAVK
ncbi:MAG: T9SS type A sorting domain-containing protein [Bacteroidales bacterium]|nr:T9SS type A sorting domain-containing protein [Bacteroidales bacterium]